MMYESTDHGSDIKILFHGGFVCVMFSFASFFYTQFENSNDVVPM